MAYGVALIHTTVTSVNTFDSSQGSFLTMVSYIYTTKGDATLVRYSCPWLSGVAIRWRHHEASSSNTQSMLPVLLIDEGLIP